MFHRVLLCYDGTREGRNALRQGADVVICMHSQVYLLAISRNLVSTAIPEGVTPELCEQEDERADALLQEGIAWLRERGVAAQGSLEYGNAATHRCGFDRAGPQAARTACALVERVR
jgi:hypothetical protein